MSRWLRRLRLVIGVFAVVFALFLARQFKHVTPTVAGPTVPRTDPGAVVEITGGRSQHWTTTREAVEISYAKQYVYADGSSKLEGVKLVADDKSGPGRMEASAKEAIVSKDQSAMQMSGDVQLVSSTTRARTEHATYTKSDNTIRAPGPTEVREGRTTASGIGMLFDRDRDVLTILDRAVVHIAADKNGDDASDITSDTVTFARRERYRRFES